MLAELITSAVEVSGGSPVLWVFGVMLAGFTFGIFLNVVAFMASGKSFTDFFHH